VETQLTVDAFGALAVQDLVVKWLREGRLYFYNRGNTTTPVTFTNTAILYTRPSLVIRVPSGKTVLPVYLGVGLETQAGVINEGVWIACNNDVGAGTSTAVGTGTNRGNMRMDRAGDPGGCLINITYTGDVTATGTNPVEFARYTQPFADTIGLTDKWEVSIKQDANIPMLVGPASLQLIIGGGTAPTGYATVIWAEFNSGELGL
jgi:hypothetical protein